MQRMLTITILTTVLLAGATEKAVGMQLQGDIAVLEAWVGTWHFDGAWANGTKLWSQAEYRPLLEGAFLEGKVFVRDGEGELYQRYRSIFARKSADTPVDAHTFTTDGSYAVGQLEVMGNVIATEWSAGETTISERMEITTPTTMRWQVWASPEAGDRALIMDGTWQKIETEPIARTVQPLADTLRSLESLLGGWEISAPWSDGKHLWSRSEYEAGLSGHFIDSKTWTLDDEGNDFQRYETVFTSTPEEGGGKVVSFDFHGGISVSDWDIADDAVATPFLEILGQPDSGGELRQTIVFEGEDFQWKVTHRTDDASPWNELMDGTWRRQGPPAGVKRFAIDSERFVASGPDVRSFVKEATVNAPVSEVYAAWTTTEGWAKLWGPPSSARIELAIGGRYEWLFNGWLGGNGSQILSYIPDRMVSFSWNAPPGQPDTRLARTWVVVETSPVDAETTHLRLTHLGFGDGPQWDQTFAYFDSAWTYVLQLMTKSL